MSGILKEKPKTKLPETELSSPWKINPISGNIIFFLLINYNYTPETITSVNTRLGILIDEYIFGSFAASAS